MPSTAFLNQAGKWLVQGEWVAEIVPDLKSLGTQVKQFANFQK